MLAFHITKSDYGIYDNEYGSHMYCFCKEVSENIAIHLYHGMVKGKIQGTILHISVNLYSFCELTGLILEIHDSPCVL